MKADDAWESDGFDDLTWREFERIVDKLVIHWDGKASIRVGMRRYHRRLDAKNKRYVEVRSAVLRGYSFFAEATMTADREEQDDPVNG
jgi:hypothetical protein